jgi:hypothetical protein
VAKILEGEAGVPASDLDLFKGTMGSQLLVAHKGKTYLLEDRP